MSLKLSLWRINFCIYIYLDAQKRGKLSVRKASIARVVHCNPHQCSFMWPESVVYGKQCCSEAVVNRAVSCSQMQSYRDGSSHSPCPPLLCSGWSCWIVAVAVWMHSSLGVQWGGWQCDSHSPQLLISQLLLSEPASLESRQRGWPGVGLCLPFGQLPHPPQ